MKNLATIVSHFETELQSILAQKEETISQMKKTDEASLASMAMRDPRKTEQDRLAQMFKDQPKKLQTGINLTIDSEELADEVHNKILTLIEEKSYPIEEVEWLHFLDSQKWHFKFNY